MASQCSRDLKQTKATPAAVLLLTVGALICGVGLTAYAQQTSKASILSRLYSGDFEHIGSADKDKTDMLAVTMAIGDFKLPTDCLDPDAIKKELGIGASEAADMYRWLITSSDSRPGEKHVIVAAPRVPYMPGNSTYQQTLMEFASRVEAEKRAEGAQRGSACRWVTTLDRNIMKLLAGRAGINSRNGTGPSLPRARSHGLSGIRSPNPEDLRSPNIAIQGQLKHELQDLSSRGTQLLTCRYIDGGRPASIYTMWYRSLPEMSAELRAAMPSVLFASLPGCPQKEESLDRIREILSEPPPDSVTSGVRPLDLQNDGVQEPNAFDTPTPTSRFFDRLMKEAAASGKLQILECKPKSDPQKFARFWYRALPPDSDIEYLTYVEEWYGVLPVAISACPAAEDSAYFVSLFGESRGATSVFNRRVTRKVSTNNVPDVAGRATGIPPAVRPVVAHGVEIPAGTVIAVRTIDAINSETAKEGQTFNASLNEPILASNQTVAAKGAEVVLKLAVVSQSGKITGATNFSVTINSIMIDGTRIAVNTGGITSASESRGKQSARVTGKAPAIGAILGGMVGGGKGAAIGGAVGVAAGMSVQMLTKGPKVRIPSETRLSFTLASPVVIGTN